MSENLPVPAPQNSGEFILYQSQDGRTRVEVRIQDETVWLSQKAMAALFEKDIRTVNDHIRNIFEEGELRETSVIRKYRITAAEAEKKEEAETAKRRGKTMRNCRLVVLSLLLAIFVRGALAADEPNPAARRERAIQFHLRAQERTGLLVPMYVYPADIHTNRVYNRLIDLKRRYETVPFWVIVNPASGPGKQVDANYTKAIDRLLGAGCVVLGYVSTSYGKRPAPEVQADIDRWLKMYPRTQGIFFDEMIYEDTEAAAKHQASLSRYAREAGCWPTVANPGAETPGRYFAVDAADVIVVHEGKDWPEVNAAQRGLFRRLL